MIKSLYLKGYPAKRLTDEFLEKSWTKRGINKLFKKLRKTGTINRRQGSGRPRSARTEENGKILLQKFPQSATAFVLPVISQDARFLMLQLLPGTVYLRTLHYVILNTVLNAN